MLETEFMYVMNKYIKAVVVVLDGKSCICKREKVEDQPTMRRFKGAIVHKSATKTEPLVYKAWNFIGHNTLIKFVDIFNTPLDHICDFKNNTMVNTVDLIVPNDTKFVIIEHPEIGAIFAMDPLIFDMTGAVPVPALPPLLSFTIKKQFKIRVKCLSPKIFKKILEQIKTIKCRIICYADFKMYEHRAIKA